MTRWLLFLHIASVAFWLGGIAALFVLYRKAAGKEWDNGRQLAYDTTKSVVRGILNPSALTVLLTGIVMIIQMGLMGRAKPFWLAFMEQFGGLVALISAGLLTWQIRGVERASSPAERDQSWRRLHQTMAYVGAGVVVTILVVALRISI
ncbi:MAG TPA: hypothetical protein VK008_06320 [Sphingobacteriaceae bacterium]|nr:hypothetical protein [Sphingobacteriaceae bacterium]